MFSFVYNYFNKDNASSENNSDIKIDDMDIDQFLDFIKNKEFKKIDTNDPEYQDFVKNLNIDQDELLFFEYELYQELYKKFGEKKMDGTHTPRNPLLKKKIYVEPKFDKNIYQTGNYDVLNNSHTNNLTDEMPLSFEHVVPVNNTKFNENKITLQEFNDTFRESQNSRDMLGVSKAMIENLPEILKQSLVKKFNSIIDDNNHAKHKPHNIGKGSLVYKVAKR